VQEAEDKLLGCKQGSDSLPTYISRFERLLYEAHGQAWPDSNKIIAFRSGLSSVLRNRLAQQLQLPSTYSAYIHTVQQLSSRSAAPQQSLVHF
jgi:hypothetical protein